MVSGCAFTVYPKAPAALAEVEASPSYWAVIACAPAVSALMVRVA